MNSIVVEVILRVRIVTVMKVTSSFNDIILNRTLNLLIEGGVGEREGGPRVY